MRVCSCAWVVLIQRIALHGHRIAKARGLYFVTSPFRRAVAKGSGCSGCGDPSNLLECLIEAMCGDVVAYGIRQQIVAAAEAAKSSIRVLTKLSRADLNLHAGQ